MKNIYYAKKLILIILLLGSLIAVITACAEPPVIGPVDDSASIALISFEMLDDGYDGVVYRRVNRFNSLISRSVTPVLAVFYSPQAPINHLLMPVLEQMAQDYHGRLQIVWIDAESELGLAQAYDAEILPQFSILVRASLRRSLVGFDQEGAVRLRNLIEPFLTPAD